MIQLALAVLLAAATADSSEVELTLLDGTTVAGRVTAWDARGVTVDSVDGIHPIPSTKLLGLRGSPRYVDSGAPALWMELVDDSRLTIIGFTCENRLGTVSSPFGQMSIPTGLIRRVDLQPQTEAATTVWRQLDERQLAGDALLVIKREGAPLDYLTGVVGDVTADEVAFKWDGQDVPIKRGKVAGISYYHADPQPLRDAVCNLTTVGGSTIPIRKITLDKDKLRILTPAGVKLTVGLDMLASADFSAGKLVYLSDLKPTAERWTPRVALPDAASLIVNYGAPRGDVSYAGSPLSLAWPDEALPSGRDVRTYAKGLALRSRTEVTYRLPPGMKRFSATAGIDPATTEQGHVLLEIRADDRVIWEGEIDGAHPPVEIDLELKAARRLHVRVDYGRNLDYGDRLHLVDARVTQ